MESGEIVGLPWVALCGFLRVSTNPRVFRSPLAVERAVAIVDAWLAVSGVVPIDAGPDHWRILARLLRELGTGGNLSTDAHIAAMAIERGATLFSCDSDFVRFPGLRWINPLMRAP